jgi:hypothetical protein
VIGKLLDQQVLLVQITVDALRDIEKATVTATAQPIKTGKNGEDQGAKTS